MRNRIIEIGILGICIAAGFFTACHNNTDIQAEIKYTGTSVNMADSNQKVEAGGDKLSLSFSSTAAWVASASLEDGAPAAWIEIFPSSGKAGDATVEVVVNANSTLVSREAKVAISSGDVSVGFTVEQYAKKPVDVTGISIEPGDDLYLVPGKTVSLSAVVTPEDADITSPITWVSSNDAVATVSSKGLVKAIAKGNAVITVYTGSHSNSLKVTVEDYVKLTAIQLNNPTPFELEKGQTFQLVPSFIPANANDLHIEWKSSNTVAADVDENGLITARDAGESTITVSSGNVSTSSVLTVYVWPTRVIMNSSKQELIRGGNFQLSYTLVPTAARVSKVEWTSSNPDVARVNGKGLVTGITGGDATITVYVYGKEGSEVLTSTCDFTIKVAEGDNSTNGEDLDYADEKNPWK